MSPDREKLLSKIQALLAMSDTARGATPAEAESFLRKAQELMAKNGIEEMELAELCGDDAVKFDIDKEEVIATHARRNADIFVARVLAEAFGVKIIHSQRHVAGSNTPKQCYILIGDALDRAVAKAVIPMLFNTMSGGAKAWMKANGKTFSVGLERSYCEGVYKGYVTASNEGKAKAMEQLSKTQKEHYGLILTGKQDAIALFTKEAFPKLGGIRFGRSEGSAEANKAGFAKGATLELTPNKKIK